MGTELLEREPQLDALTRWWSEAAAGAGRLVFVAGEAGVGKTSLVRRFCNELPAAPRVLVGTCEPLATPTPLGPLLDMAATLPPRFEEILSGSGDPVVVRRAFLDEIGGPTATLVVVEDAHWADEATLDLLRHVGRRLGGRRCMVVVTYREDEVGRHHPLRVVMGDLATLAEVRRLQLRTLSVAAVARLTEGMEVDAERLHRQTGGNPFFVTEVLAAGDVSGSVRDAVLARASRLGPEARQALDAAACLGARATPALVQEVSGQGPAAVDECLESGMLVQDGDEVAFRHELARLAVEGTVPPRRRTAYHARALDALRDLPGVDPARLADHAERAGDRAAVFRYACAAAQRAARLASHREAAAHYARALDVADGQPDEVRAALLEARSHECYMSHDVVGSHEAAEEARQLWQRLGDDRRSTHSVLTQVNAYLTVAAWLPRAERALEEVIGLLETLPPGPELPLAWAVRATFEAMAFRNADAVRSAKRAEAIAEEIGDANGLGEARLRIGVGLVQGGDEGGWPLMDQCRRDVLSGPPHPFYSWAIWWPYHVAASQRLYALADQLYAEGMAYALEHDLETIRQFFLAWRARQLLEQGQWDQADALAARVINGIPLEDGRRLMALVTLARVRVRRGHDAAALLDEARRTEEPARPVGEWIGRLPGVLAEEAWFSGRRDDVPALLEHPFMRAVARGEPWSLGELAFWLWRAGALEEVPEGMAEPYALVVAGRYRQAHGAWKAIGCPFEAAQSLACSDDEDALREALAVFDELGARPERDDTARRLRQLGVRSIPKARSRGEIGVEALSPRESEVLTMLGEGLRNAEIASKLFVSERTVEHHVAAILRKLGLRSRVDAGRFARQRGER